MEKSNHEGNSVHQPSLFALPQPEADESLTCSPNAIGPPAEDEPYTVEDYLAEPPGPEESCLALDRLLDALEELLRGNYPVNEELRQRLSNPALEALIFQEMNKILKLE
jgi:hypothetical protein